MEDNKRRLEKPEKSRGCLLRRDLEKGQIRARHPVKIDESINEEKDPDDIDQEDLPGDPRLERVAKALHNEILSGSKIKLPPEHLDLEQRKRMTADTLYRPEVSEHSFPDGVFPRSWGRPDSESSQARLFSGAAPPPIFDTNGIQKPFEFASLFLQAHRDLPRCLRKTVRDQSKLIHEV